MYYCQELIDEEYLSGASASNCDSGISDGSPGPQVENNCDDNFHDTDIAIIIVKSGFIMTLI